MTWKIPLFKTHSEKSDIEAITKVLVRKTYWAVGPEIKEFEEKISSFVGKKYGLAFNSGTSALHTLLLAHDVKGKEVIVPSFTFISTSNAVILAGGIPVFAESEDDTLGLDIDDVISKINENTAAVIPLHYGGFPSRDIIKLKEVCKDKNILLIEDSAESLGSHIDGEMVGNFGDSSIFSFCQNKVLATGEGGILLTDSEEIYEKAKLIRSHGRFEDGNDYFSSVGDNDYIQIGYNYRMPSIIAALGISQFGNMNTVIELRRKNSHHLIEGIKHIDKIKLMIEYNSHFQVYQMFTIILQDNKIRDGLQKYLTEKGIMTKVYFNPVHLKTIYVNNYGCKEGDLPFTEALSGRVLTLPMYPDLNIEDLDLMIKEIKNYFGD